MIDFASYPDLCAPSDLSVEVSEGAVRAASDVIRRACGWHIAPEVTETLVLDSDGGRILALPSLRVTGVSGVTDADDVAIEGWSWSSSGLLERADGCWPRGFQSVKVAVTHGFVDAPPGLLSLVAEVAQELANAEVSAGGVEQIGPFRFAAGRAASSWTAGELAVLSRLRVEAMP